MEKAAFAAGCFWGIQDAFSNLKGVVSTLAGYAGGDAPNPSYQQVCSGKTGHAETVEVTFDPQIISYETLLELFWKIHDPTTLNRQGPDRGSQYRSAIFFYTPQQETAARLSMAKHQTSLSQPIVTEILPARKFYQAEEYHQHYAKKHGRHC